MRKTSDQTLHLLRVLVPLHPNTFIGYEVIALTGLKSGSVYPILTRLTRWGWLKQEVQPNFVRGRRPVSVYSWTMEGLLGARRLLWGVSQGRKRSIIDPW
jgi:PadR family transcriptional regulator, regulatory protein PadR